MIKYTDLFAELSSCILPFCVNAAQEKQVLRLKFILIRGFREFIKFYEINPYIISRVSQDMKDKCSMHINEESSSIFIEHFIRNMSKELLTRLFKTLAEVTDYEKMFIEYRSKFILPEETYLRIEEDYNLNKLHIGINFVKADIHLRNGDRVNAGVIFISLLQLLCRQGLLVDEMDPNTVNIEDKLNDLWMEKLQVIQKIVKVLVALEIRRYPNAIDLAISLTQHANEIDAACEVYELKLQSYPNDIPKLVGVYQNYADYCIKWGRYSDAKKLLQKKLRLQNYNYAERVVTVNAIYQLVEDYSRSVDEEK
jgi:tetratricopeptide (TPR) repeat protein